jgi:hypothetical protein
VGRLRCTATTKAGAPCPHYALPGKAICFAHDDPAAQAARGRRGGQATQAKERAQRAAEAAALRAGCIADLRAALETAMRQAYTDGDWSTVISAVRAGLDLIKGDYEAEVRALREAIEEYVTHRERLQ